MYLKQTHSLALMMIQSGEGESQTDEDIPRLKKTELKDLEIEDVPLMEYKGPKKPQMPAECALQKVPPLRD